MQISEAAKLLPIKTNPTTGKKSVLLAIEVKQDKQGQKYVVCTFIGGKVDEGDSLEQTIFKEFYEETGQELTEGIEYFMTDNITIPENKDRPSRRIDTHIFYTPIDSNEDISQWTWEGDEDSMGETGLRGYVEVPIDQIVSLSLNRKETGYTLPEDLIDWVTDLRVIPIIDNHIPNVLATYMENEEAIELRLRERVREIYEPVEMEFAVA